MVPAKERKSGMSPHMKFGIAGVIIGLILFIISPWLAIGVIVAAVAIPAILWAMLDPSQRRRVRRARGRKQLGG
jgi:Flp pilus assembly protein TadB